MRKSFSIHPMEENTSGLTIGRLLFRVLFPCQRQAWWLQVVFFPRVL